MNRDNLQKANKVNEKLTELEKHLGWLEDGGHLEVYIRYKGYNPVRLTLGPEAKKVINMLAVDSLKTDAATLNTELEAL